MSYLKKQLDNEATDTARINLSVRDDKLSPEPLCDFCASSIPAYVYAASRMSDGRAVPANVTCWRWMACAKCSRMVDNGNWDSLQRHMAGRFRTLFALKLENQFKGGVPDSLIHEAVQESLKQFHDYAVSVMDAGAGKTHHT